MPLDTDTFDLGDEVERLREQQRELEDQRDGLDEDNPAYDQVQDALQTLNRWINGLRWMRSPEHGDGVYESVVLGGLTGGEVAHVEDELNGAGRGISRVYTVAKGTIAADYTPWEGARPDDATGLEDGLVAAVSDLPDGYLRWADAQINGLMSLSGNGRPRSADGHADARTQANATTEN